MNTNPFLTLRNAVVSHLRQPLTGARPFLRRCPGARQFYLTPITLKKKDEIAIPLTRKRVVVPPHNPTRKPLRGKKIGIAQVHLLDPSTGKRGHVRSLDELVDSLDPEEFLVELVEEYPPTVKLVDVKSLRAATVRERLKEKPLVNKDVTKEMLLTWGMAEADEKHKLVQIRGYLEKGLRVDIEIQTKKKQAPPAWSELNTRVDELAASFADVSKEWKTRVLTRRRALLYLQSKLAKSAKVDVEALKESVPKSVQLRRLAAEKQRLKEQQHEQQNKTLEPSPESYNNLWGV